VAAGFPLPQSLAGFTVMLYQGGTLNPLAVPILSARQIPCFSPPRLNCPAMTTLTVQIPFEVIPDCLACLRPGFISYLTISDRGQSSATVLLSVPADNIHVVSPCDTTSGPAVLSGGVPCNLVYRANGTAISPGSPARVGEQLVIYAFGLGQTQPL